MSQDIIVYGAGGFACEVAWLVQSCSQGDENFNVVCFVDDNEELHGRSLIDIPVMSQKQAETQFPSARLVAAIGRPQVRQKVTQEIESAGFSFEKIIHPNVEMSKWIEIGEGAVICAGNILTTNIRIGRHVQINLGCTIGHDAVLDDFTTLAPGVHVSGWVHFGKRVYVGTGAVIINGTEENPLVIGDDAVIGAGAVVVGDIPKWATVVGVPAKVIKVRDPS